MSTYATPAATSSSGGFSDPKTYFKISALALAAVALLGILLNALGMGALLGANFLAFDWTHDAVHVLLAVVAGVLGFGAASHATAKTMAKVVGLTYLGLGVVGFVAPGILGFLGLHLEIGENLAHILLGGWGAYTGFAG